MIEFEKYNFLVCVQCYTFNHATYIADAMNGFTMQETDFPFICKIVDDASTDGEQKVINHYLQEHFNIIEPKEDSDNYELVLAQHQENKNCYFAVYFLKFNHYQRKLNKLPYMTKGMNNVKYIAMCEGDDYWIDGRKLNKQVTYLESHPKNTLCIHAYRRDNYQLNNISSKEIHKYPQNVDIIPEEDVINGTGMFGATASMLYRSEAANNYPEWALKAPVGDRPLKFVLFARGHIAYIDEIMCVYRVGVPGSWTNRVSRNRRAEKETRTKFIQLLLDFDEWTNQKHHKLVKKAIREYRKAYLRRDCINLIKQGLNSILDFLK